MHPEWLLSELEDPFQMFPLEAVARTLAESISDSEAEITQSAGWGVSPKYRSVAEEHHIEVMALLIGAVCVLGQAALMQSVAIVRKLRGLVAEPSRIPKSKADILAIEATVHPETGLSEMVLVDAVANYFKHYQEWPEDWNHQQTSGPQKQTIALVRRLGLSPGNLHDNLCTAVQRLGLRPAGVDSLAARIQAWRERLAESLRRVYMPQTVHDSVREEGSTEGGGTKDTALSAQQGHAGGRQ